MAMSDEDSTNSAASTPEQLLLEVANSADISLQDCTPLLQQAGGSASFGTLPASAGVLPRLVNHICCSDPLSDAQIRANRHGQITVHESAPYARQQVRHCRRLCST